MLQFFFQLYRTWRMSRASRGALDHTTCIACESKDVTSLAKEVYHCNACHYEGGDGYAAWSQQQRAAHLNTLPEAQRRERAKKVLLETRHILLGASGDIKRAQRSGFMDIAGIGGTAGMGAEGEGGEKYNELMGAARLIMEAQQNVRDAAVLLYGEQTQTAEIGAHIPGFFTTAMDIHLDNLLSDLSFLSNIGKLNQQIETLSESVNEALAQEFGL